MNEAALLLILIMLDYNQHFFNMLHTTRRFTIIAYNPTVTY